MVYATLPHFGSRAPRRPLDLHWDMSGDGSVTSLDALMILQAVGKTDHIWSLEALLTFPYFKTSVN